MEKAGNRFFASQSWRQGLTSASSSCALLESNTHVPENIGTRDGSLTLLFMFLQQIIANLGLQFLNAVLIAFRYKRDELRFRFLEMKTHRFQHPLETCQLVQRNVQLF